MRKTAEAQMILAKLQLQELFGSKSARATSGQELVEYALLVGFIAVTIAAIIPYQVTGPISYIFNKIHNIMVTYANG